MPLIIVGLSNKQQQKKKKNNKNKKTKKKTDYNTKIIDMEDKR